MYISNLRSGLLWHSIAAIIMTKDSFAVKMGNASYVENITIGKRKTLIFKVRKA